MKKRLVSLILAAVMLCTLLPQISLQVGAIKADLSIIHDPNAVSGKDFSSTYANKLDKIFKGTAPLFSNTTQAYPIGTSLNNSKTYAVANAISGKQCYIYAQAVYYYLFGDIPFKGDGYMYWSDSKKVVSNEPSFSYELFVKSGVGFGAYIRTTKNSDGSYNGNVGHSMIVLTYDKSSITYIDCNQNGYGLIQVQKRSWENFNAEEIVRKGRRISHIIQCVSAMCDHTTEEGKSAFVDSGKTCGVCSECGFVYNWESTFDASDAGVYQLVNTTYEPRTEPYTNSAKGGFCLANPKQVEVIGSYTNAYGNKWYAVEMSGKEYYIYSGHMKYIRKPDFKVSCTGFAPANNADVPKQSHNVEGMVTSTYPLKSIEAYLDGKKVATWTASDQNTKTVQLKNTPINYNLKFGSLATGKHTITLKAYNLNGTAVQFHSSVFYTVDTVCSHSFGYKVTKSPTVSAAGLLSGTCSKCSVTKEITLPKLSTTDYSYKVTKAATCTAAGTGRYTWKTTTYGSFYFDVSLSATGHRYTDKVTAATCTTQGYTTHTCSCGYSYKDAYQNALGHNYVYGNCTRCRKIDSNYCPEYGDLNGDNQLSDADAIYLLYATFDSANYPLVEIVDYNKDGYITDADAIYLLYATFDSVNYPLG